MKQKAREPMTILLFSYTKKPIQIQLTKWVKIGIAFGVSLMLGLGTTAPYLCVRSLKATELERQLRDMKVKQQVSDSENQGLKKEIEDQKQELYHLQQLSEEIQKKQDELDGREKAVREKLGLEQEEIQTEAAHEEAELTAKLVRESLLQCSARVEGQFMEYQDYLNTIEQAERKRIQRKEEMARLREKMVSYAKQFLGGKYVYGQNDPHTGVDCSGFTKYIYRNVAGISLHRTAAEQSNQGIPITKDTIQAGDLVFYGGGGGINHVALYIGDGKVIHASNEENGIIISQWNYRSPVKIRNLIGE